MGRAFGMWFIDFGQLYKRVPVYGGKISFILSESGDVLSITMNHFPGIDLSDPEVFDSEMAAEAAKSDIAAFHPSKDFEILEEQMIVFPVQDQEKIRFVWAWNFEFKYPNPIEKWHRCYHRQAIQ